MVYALNVFNLVSSKENLYREYSVKAGKIIYSKGGKVISSACNPIRKLKGDIGSTLKCQEWLRSRLVVGI